MFKLMFGFIAGIVFSIATICLAAVGVSIALENDKAKKPAPKRSSLLND